MSRSALLLSALLSGCSSRAVLLDAGPDDAGRWTEGTTGIEVMFCPDEDTVTVEVAEIQKVVDARKADPATYAEGENPYRIRYAVYNLRNPSIGYALADAEDAGVDVQVLIDADQLDPARDWNWVDDYLRNDRGWSYAEDHRDLSSADRATTDLIGIDGAGLMHLKTRLFETPDYRSVISGSMNPGDDAVFNDETFHLIHDLRIVEKYDAAFEGVLYGTGLHNSWDEGAGLNVLFTPEASGPLAGTALLSWLAEEDEQILLMVFSLRDLTAPGVSGSLVKILGDKVAAGVPVILITDRNQSDGFYDTTEDKLRAVGVQVYEARNHATEFTAMHHKVAILGRTDIRVVTDASNWSKAGFGSSTTRATNTESVLFVEPSYDGGKLGRRYLAQFLRVLERYADQSLVDGEAPFAEVAPDLMGREGWPWMPIGFVADEAWTTWGEGIRVVGDQPGLGMWGQEGLGVPMWTDAGLYPTWMAGEDLWLPVGTSFQYKLVAEQNGQLRWESGENQVGFAQPPAFGEGERLELRTSWR